MAKQDTESFASPRELIVVTRPEAGLRASAGRFESIADRSAETLQQVLKRYRASMVPLFGATEERVQLEAAGLARGADASVPDLTRFYRVDVQVEEADELAAALADDELVDSAYVKPGAEPPIMDLDLAPTSEEAPSTSPDFTARQGYLNPSPEGVDAVWAWNRPGGRGQNMRIIDIEGAWRFGHEDLTANQGGVVGGTESTDIRWRNHGTAVLGEYSGDESAHGIRGICDLATASAISIFGGIGSSQAILAATRRLRPGDIILIELHRPGPRHNFRGRTDQRGYIAIEWWEDDFAAIRAATTRGIIVVEAAGNGAEDLDDAIYQSPGPGFPSAWTNPFRRSNRDSGAIVVGAGAPPEGTHGRSHGPDRSRLDFSNYGALVDAQGWGREVTTCGYGDLQGGTNEDLWYTDRFSGTSSASPIVVGAIGCIQGMARAANVAPPTPAQVKQCLRSTGAQQADAPGRPRTQRIGNLPDIRGLHDCLLGPALKLKEKDNKELKEKDNKELKEKDNKELKEKDNKELKEKDNKELKEKDNKELKEKDNKELKEKDNKELKEKDNKELKEKDNKELKEKDNKEFKEKDKDIFEGQVAQGSVPSTDARIAALEDAVSKLSHFISSSLRPDLAARARDYSGGGPQQGDDLSDQAQNAKQNKDIKDAEA